MNVVRQQTSHNFTCLLIAVVAVVLSDAVLLAQDAAIAGDGSCTLREAISNASGDSDTASGDRAAGETGNTRRVCPTRLELTRAAINDR